MAEKEKKKEGKIEIQKCEYLENKKNFLDKIKIFFLITYGLSFGEKKNEKIAEKSFSHQLLKMN